MSRSILFSGVGMCFAAAMAAFGGDHWQALGLLGVGLFMIAVA